MPALSGMPELWQRGGDALHAWADRITTHIAQHERVVVAGSVAEGDLAHDEWDGPWGRPTEDLVYDVQLRVGFVVDHLNALAAVLHEPRATFSVVSILRPLLVALSQLSWLYETDPTDTRERTRRFYALRLESIAEQQNLAKGVPPGTASAAASGAELARLDAERDAVRGWAQCAGVPFVVPRPPRWGGAPTAQVGDRVPSEQDLFAVVTAVDPAGDQARGAAIAATLYRTMSAVVHAQPHGLRQYLEQTQTPDGKPAVRIMLNQVQSATMIGAAFTAANLTMRRLCAYYGWDLHAWAEAVEPDLMYLRSELAAAVQNQMAKVATGA